jgi:hypothetical protein
VVSQLKVNEIIKQSGSSITIGEDGDTLSGPFTNVPAFFVSKTSTQSVSSDTLTLVTWDSEVIDTNNAFASNKFTVPSGKGGIYYFGCILRGTCDANTAEFMFINFYKNGSRSYVPIFPQTTSNNMSNSKWYGSIVYQLVAGDYIEVYGNNSGTSAGFGGSSDLESQSNFFGYRLIGA